MNATLLLLLSVIVAACGVAAWVFVSARERRRVLQRIDGVAISGGPAIPILRDAQDDLTGRVGRWLKRNTPEHWGEAGDTGTVLLHAGFESPVAPLIYNTVRITTMVLLPIIAVVFGPQDRVGLLVLFVAIAAAAGMIGPRALVDRMVRNRRDSIKKSIPDSLDLLVVCVEAGVGLDAAMLRVARDMAGLHPELSSEFLVVNRKMNAGLSREEAVYGLYNRTGLDELRGLASSMIQSERLGSSIARVLRVYAETLRRKRKQMAEKRAAEASIKMMIPLATCMLPALFAIILGPAFLTLAKTFSGASLQ